MPTHFDSFQFDSRFQCMASYHCKALSEYECLNCKSLSMHPNYPMLSMPLQLKERNGFFQSLGKI